MLGEHLGVQIEDLRLTAIAGFLVAAMSVVGVVITIAVVGVLMSVGHGSTVSLLCASSTITCEMRNKVA
ncbi:hypothetical protein GCM10018773_62380 [Streptomyces candidus]|nr:hypothetical protein GCM10018773_62380 [Streptomyces candidus]